MDFEPARRRSPQWVRDLDDRTLHAVAIRLRRQAVTEDLSQGQEWLWGALISELEYRWRAEPRVLLRCSCSLCVAPFPD